jgi:PAS domain S-box-containing protein
VTSLRSLPLAAALVDDALQVRECSRRCLALFGLTAEADGEAKLSQSLAAATDLGDELALATARLVKPGTADTFEWRRDERLFEVSVAADDDEGQTFLVSFLDVTDGRHIEQIQQEARNYLEQILADIPLGVVVLDGGLRITFVNAAILRLLSRIGERVELVDAIGSSSADLVPGGAGQRWQDLCAGARDSGQRVDGERERFDKAANGEDLVLEAAAHPLHDRRGQSLGAILVVEDVTEKAGLEGEVIRMERLATVGQMVITVNHEINNPLTIITANAQAARLLNRDLDEKTVAKLQMIEAQVKRISEVTERLRTMDQVESDDYIADGPKMIDLGTRENESD